MEILNEYQFKNYSPSQILTILKLQLNIIGETIGSIEINGQFAIDFKEARISPMSPDQIMYTFFAVTLSFTVNRNHIGKH